MDDRKKLVLTREPGESVVFTVDRPCSFAVVFDSKTRSGGGLSIKLLVVAPEAVQVARSELKPEIAAEMLASIERKGRKS